MVGLTGSGQTDGDGNETGELLRCNKGHYLHMDYRRADRVGDVILQELAYLLQRKVKDPRLENITLTQVQVSADLRHARVFYSVLATDEMKVAVAAGLESARGYLKRELGRRLQLRYMPDIVFCYDDSLDHGSRIHRLLTELKKTDLA
jgi:ribosome-binding factor A